jgi:hypothetical protein
MATLDDVYRKFGEVSEAAQLLETALGNILILVDGVQAGLLDTPDPDKASVLLNSINRHTLGQLLKRLNRSTDSAAHLDDLLARALGERNRLSHSFYRQHNFRRNSESGCDLMFEDLNNIHELLLEAFKAVSLLSGIDLEKVVMETFPTGHIRI